jgi:hypothetical protein
MGPFVDVSGSVCVSIIAGLTSLNFLATSWLLYTGVMADQSPFCLARIGLISHSGEPRRAIGTTSALTHLASSDGLSQDTVQFSNQSTL